VYLISNGFLMDEKIILILIKNFKKLYFLYIIQPIF
jgi:hypothetical protein